MKTKTAAVGEFIGLPLLLLFDFMMPMEQASLQCSRISLPKPLFALQAPIRRERRLHGQQRDTVRSLHSSFSEPQRDSPAGRHACVLWLKSVRPYWP